MLAWEEAGARLSAVADQHWLRSARQRVGRLESELQSLAEPLLEPRTWSLHGEQQRKLSEAATGLDELGGEQLRSVMDALHPQLGPSLAAWWKAAVSQPFGWGPGAFRAPSDPALTRDRRIRDLKDLVGTAGPHAEPLEWFAAWAPYLSVPDRFVVEPVDIGPLLAAGIDAGGPVGEATFRTLIDSATGEHPIGGMGSHVIVGLLRSSRTGGWEFIESMLLTAQRQEGLRQSILEAAGGAHPDAFTRIIDLISSEDLIRFAATISAVSAWLGFPEHAERLDDAERRLRLLQAYRTDRGLAARQVIEGEAWDTYVGLCATAQHDVLPALDLAREALRLADRDNRAAALRFLVYSGLPIEYLLPSFVAAMADPDLGVASMAHRALVWNGYRPEASDGELYGALDDLARRLPEKTRRAEPVGIDPDPVPLDRGAVVATMTAVLGDRPLEPLLAHLPSMDPATRGALARKAGERGKLDGDLRRAVVKLVGDRSSMVRKCAVEAMEGLQVDAAEALELEPLLTRRAGDLRRGVIGLLGRLPVSDALDSSRRLWNGSELQRDAACELLSTLDRRPAVVATAQGFLADGASETQQAFLALVVGEKQSGVDDRTLGLFTPDEMTAPHPPHTGPEGRRFSDPAAFRILGELDDLAESHRNTVLELVTWQDSTEVLLADATWLPGAFHRNRAWAGELDWGMVLPEVFRGWWDNRPADCRGESEALDALRALVVSQLCVDHEDPSFIRGRRSPVRELLRPLVGPDLLQLRHPGVVRHVLEWLLVEAADQSVIDECMDATEVALASIPGTWLQRLTESVDEGRRYEVEWRGGFVQLCPWITLTQNLLIGKPSLMTTDNSVRWMGLMRWLDQPIEGARRYRVRATFLFDSHAVGGASDADVYDALIGTDGRDLRFGGGELRAFTKRRRDRIEQRHPTVVPLADRVRERIIEIERARGDLSTSASHLTFGLASIEGADVTLDLLARLDRSALVRGHAWSNDGREVVYSHLIQISHPAAGDTPGRVAELVATHRIRERRLIELAMYAPQWASTIEAVLGWDGLEDAIWWFHAHTKDDRWSVEREVRETWAAMSAERTPLTAEDLTEGAVDVEWFFRAHARLGAERWAELHKAARLASGGSGHRRAQIFAEAMLGELSETELVSRITTKRHQDSVRAIGLVPLPAKDADGVALSRYQLLREFERGSRKFGRQRQRSEATAVRIGIENLSRTAGAPDPQRFVWAMEAAEAGDLADGPVTVTADDVAVTLSVDAEGLPDIAVQRGGKRLKSVPSKLRKHADIKALTDRRTALRRQAGRVRRSFEDAMIRQDVFADADFEALGRHPVVAPMLDLLVWVDEVGATFRRSGPDWVDARGATTRPSGAVRIAHPVDLHRSGDWIDWQRQLFDDARRQPFKQAFRELYVLTPAEATDSPASQRWAGHQVRTQQALALFSTRGWLVDRGSGEVAKVFHRAGFAARVTFVEPWGTPAEVELPTIDAVCFTRSGAYLAQPLDSVPPVVFSEAMRDLDLVVSVAHAGGVDPEATASTIEMRAALVRETVRLMHLDNVSRESSHILIEGSLGEYSVHLGSGTVHRRPGGSLCIIPVDPQRRGRIFLPFADDDPRSAEVVSKVLMLARDSTIKDPTILEQLRS